MGEGADMGGGDMGGGGGGADMGGGALGGGGDEALASDTTPDATGLETTGQGGSGGGMLSFAVSESMANGAGTAPSTTGITPPTTDVSGSSTAPANASAQTGTGDIIRKNPFGGDAGTPQKAAAPELTGAQKAQKVMEAYQKGSKDSEYQVQPITMSAGSGNTYAALFGSPNLMGRSNAPAAPPVPQIQAGGMSAPQMMAPAAPMPMAGGLPQPMQLQMPNPQPAPAPQLSVSDARAKQNIRYANAEMDQFLQKVYNNMSSKGKK